VEAGKQLGVDAWEKAKSLWGKLRPQVDAKPAAQEAAQDVAETSDNEDAQAALRLQLKKLLVGLAPWLAEWVTPKKLWWQYRQLKQSGKGSKH
jgi:hypothetical protein